MSVPLLFVLLAPLAGAVIAVTFGEVPSQRRTLVALCCAATVGGAGAALALAAAGESVAWRGFTTDAWRALLMLGAIVAAVAGIARAGARRRPGASEAALFAAAVLGVTPLLVREVHLLAVTLPASTIAFAAAAYAGSRRDRLGIRWVRTIGTLALSDVLALAAIAATVTKGSAFSDAPSVGVGAVLLVAAGIRVGLVPAPWGAATAERTEASIGALWHGPVRAQGLLLVPPALAAGRGVAYAAAAAAAATAVFSAVRAARDPGIGPVTAAGASFAVLGLALGDPDAVLGAALSAAATFLVVPAWYAGRAFGSSIRATAGVWPAGALLPGAAIVVTSALDASLVRHELFAFALPALAAGLMLAVVVAAGVAPGRYPDRLALGDRIGAPLWGALALAAALALAVVPARVASGIARPVAEALGVGRLLGVGPQPGIDAGLAVVLVAVAGVAAWAGPGRAGSGGPAARPPSAVLARSATLPTLRLRLPSVERIWSVAATLLIAASIAIAIRVYLVAAGRGFL